jgi:hypothetical protein
MRDRLGEWQPLMADAEIDGAEISCVASLNTKQFPAPMAPVIRTNVDFQIENRARRRQQAAIFEKRRLRNVAVFWAALNQNYTQCVWGRNERKRHRLMLRCESH